MGVRGAVVMKGEAGTGDPVHPTFLYELRTTANHNIAMYISRSIYLRALIKTSPHLSIYLRTYMYRVFAVCMKTTLGPYLLMDIVRLVYWNVENVP